MWRHVPVVASGRASTRVNVTKPVGLLSPAAASQPPDSVIVQNISIFSVVTGQPQPSISTLSVAIHSLRQHWQFCCAAAQPPRPMWIFC